jgi:hypothetical protein
MSRLVITVGWGSRPGAAKGNEMNVIKMNFYNVIEMKWVHTESTKEPPHDLLVIWYNYDGGRDMLKDTEATRDLNARFTAWLKKQGMM